MAINSTNDNILEPQFWLKKYGDYLYNYAKLRVRNSNLAEDLVQDCFFSALKAKDNFKGEANEKTWLTAIIKNKIIDHYRKASSQTAYSEYLADTSAEFDRPIYETEASQKGWTKQEAYFKDWGPLPDSILENNDLQQTLNNCLDKLPKKLAPIFISKYIDDKETNEICKDFEITTTNYWVIIHRAKILLRNCLENNFVFVS